MNTCDEYIVKMNMYLDGELPANQISDLMEHLELCDSCRKRFDGLKITAFEMRQMTQEPPDMLHGSIMRFVRENSASNQRKKWAQKLVTVAACAAFLVLVGSGALSRMNGVFLFGGQEGPHASADLASPGNAPEQNAFSVQSSTGENVEMGVASANGDPEIAPRMVLGAEEKQVEYNTDLFVLPQLSTAEPACYYIIATGTTPLTDIFPVEDVFKSETGTESYVFVEGGVETKAATEKTLFTAAFQLYNNVENLPEEDPASKFGLVVCYKK